MTDPTLDPGVAAVLTECDDLLSTALRAVEIGAYPGPAWRARAKGMRELLRTIRGDDHASRDHDRGICAGPGGCRWCEGGAP